MEKWTQIKSLIILKNRKMTTMTSLTKLTICLTTSFGIKIWKTWKSKKRMNSQKRNENKILGKESSKMKTKSKTIVKWPMGTTTSAKKRKNKTNSRRSKVIKRWLPKMYRMKARENPKIQIKMRKWVSTTSLSLPMRMKVFRKSQNLRKVRILSKKRKSPTRTQSQSILNLKSR